jgi:hypothetical protein
VEEWIDADKGIVVLCIIADGDFIKRVMNPDAESKTLENESSEEETVTEKISWAKKCRRLFYTSEICQQPILLPGTGSIAATNLAVHFSAKTKIMHQVSSLSPGVAVSVQVPHGFPVLSKSSAVLLPGGF